MPKAFAWRTIAALTLRRLMVDGADLTPEAGDTKDEAGDASAWGWCYRWRPATP